MGPLHPGAGRTFPNPAGRSEDLDNFRSLTERLATRGCERSVIYSAVRGVRKSVLPMKLDLLATEAGWAASDIDQGGSAPDFRVTIEPSPQDRTAYTVQVCTG